MEVLVLELVLRLLGWLVLLMADQIVDVLHWLAGKLNRRIRWQDACVWSATNGALALAVYSVGHL